MAAPLYKRLPAQLLGGIAQGAIGGLGSVTEALLGLGNAGINLLTGKQSNVLPSRLPLANLKESGELVGSIFGNENLTPQSFPEEVLSQVTQNLPITLATGGSNIPLAIARDVAASTAQTGAEKLNLPKAVQFFAGIAGEKGFNKTLEKLGRKVSPKYLGQLAQEAKSDFYKQVEKTGEKIKTDASKYKNKLEEVAEQVSKDTRLSLEDRKKLYRDINQYESDFNKGAITGKDLFNRRTEINEIINNSKGREKFYYQGIKKSLIDELGKQSQLNPKFGKYLTDADAIHDAQNFGSFFKEALHEHPKLGKVLKNPAAYSLASIGPAVWLSKDPVTALTTSIGIGAGIKGAKKANALIGFVRQDAPRKILLEATENMLKRNYPAAARSYNKLNQLADKYDKESKKFEDKHAAEIQKSRHGLVKRKV